MAEYMAGCDTYWRSDTDDTLATYKQYTKAALKSEFEKEGKNIKKSITKAQLLEMKQRLDKGLVIYAACSVEELRGFHEVRGISTSDNKCSTRPSLTTKLMAADLSPIFDRLFALPAELRVRTYEYYTGSFPKRLRTPAAPPLARTCKQLKAEVLPMFYSTLTIELIFLRSNTTNNCLPDHNSTLFLSNISPENLAAIRSVYLNICDTWPRDHGVGPERIIPAGTISLELDDSPEVLISDTVQYRGKGRWAAKNMIEPEVRSPLQKPVDRIREVGGREKVTFRVIEALRAMEGSIF
ncbi:hypothetical protein LTR37_002301 [Vermiconidia calcicola]|uniref:Uncharacterized protein n=1 Tax=Vermiconidia calcicola TaxID=1690605 RepID=A0ACC3NTA8_9PEZI|nr:hypothetical protein LTR37_002301 [Vermiconidia calcicola]